MLLWKEPITNRTQSDVERVLELLQKGWQKFSDDEKTEWANGMKGALNASDLARVQDNIQLLSDVLELNLAVLAVPDLPNETFYCALVQNTERIRSAYGVRRTTPKTPEMPLNTYSKWNDIEQILTDVYELLLNNFHYYCGSEIYAGDDTGFLL